MKSLFAIFASVFLISSASYAAEKNIEKFFKHNSSSAPYEVTAARFKRAPKLDGELNDSCWKKSRPVNSFMNMQTRKAAEKQTVAWAGFDDKYVYFAFAAQDSEISAKAAKKDNNDVWKGDCIEIFLSAEKAPDKERHFIIGASGSLWDGNPSASWNCEWQAKVKKQDWGYTAECRIPLSAMLDMSKYDIVRGVKWSIKLTRLNRGKGTKIMSSWTPLKGSTSDKDNAGVLVFENANILTNADFKKTRPDNLPADWNCSVKNFNRKDPAKGKITFNILSSPEKERILQMLFQIKTQRFKAEIGTRHTMRIPRQPVSVNYRFSVDARWLTSDKLNARPRPSLYFVGPANKSVKLKPGDKWEQINIDYSVSKDENKLRLRLMGARITGKLQLKNMSLEEVRDANLVDKQKAGFANTSGAFELKANKPLTIQKLGIEDCRVMTVFIHNPVDGRTDSRGYSNGRMEYPFTSGGYGRFDAYPNPSLHLKLADDKGFDAMLIRGDYQGEMVTKSGKFPVKSNSYAFRKKFNKRIKGTKIDFNRTGKKGEIADVSFYRVSSGFQNAPMLNVGGNAQNVPEKITLWAGRRFGKKISFLQAGEQKAGSINLKAQMPVQIITVPQNTSKAVYGVSFDINVAKISEQGLFTIRIQDPLNPRRELMGNDFLLNKPGRYRVTMEFPAQVFIQAEALKKKTPVYPKEISPPPVFWMTMSSGMNMTLSQVKLGLLEKDYKEALPEALAQRKFLLKGYFVAMSEPRPWTGLRPNTNIISYFKKIRSGTYVEGIEQLLETLEQCKAMAPDDDIVRQYYEWIYRRKIGVKLPPVKLESVPGAPRWALLAHEAYKALSAVPRWWFAKRLLPSGEMGGLVQDDSDFYQQMPLFPLIDDKPLGEDIKDGVARLNNLACKVKLSNGLNKRRMDILHSYEEGINHLALSTFMFYGDPVFFERNMKTASAIMDMTVEVDGKRYFSGEQMSAADIGKKKHIEKELLFHQLLLHPIYELAWYNHNPEAMKFVKEFAKNRVDLSLKFSGPQKWPIEYDLKDGVKPSRFERRPSAHYSGEPILAAYQLTQDSDYFKAYKVAFERDNYYLRRHARWPKVAECPEIKEYAKSNFSDVPYVMDDYTGFMLTGDKSILENILERTLREYRNFPHMYTSAEPYTDRVLLQDAHAVFYSYLGTYTSRNYWTHDPVVSYEGLGSDFAALVYPGVRDKVKVALFSFKDKAVDCLIRTWRLPNGIYKVKFGEDLNDDGKFDSEITGKEMRLHKYAPVKLSMPAGKLMLLEITQVKKLEPLLNNADLALSKFDTVLKNGSVVVKVHNIGSCKAENIEVGLFRKGKLINKSVISKLDAPLDLKPKVKKVIFKNVRRGDSIILDPQNKIKEITRYNNSLTI